MLHKIDQNNVRLYQGLVVCLNPKTVVGAKLRLTKLVESLDFRLGLPNFNKVIKVIENVTSLKGKIFVNIKQGHFVISALKNMDAASVEKEFLNKDDKLAKKLKNPLSKGTTRMQNCGGSKSGFLSKLRAWSGFRIFLLVQILF